MASNDKDEKKKDEKAETALSLFEAAQVKRKKLKVIKK